MKTDLTITTAGSAAITAANLNGANAVTITGIAVGAGLNIISDLAGVTALQNEISRTAFVGGEGGTSGSIAGYGLFEGPEAWTAWEIGVYARTGNTVGEFLFAYAQSVNNSSGVKIPLLVKTTNMPARYDFGFVFASSPAAVPAPSSVSCPVPLTLSCFAPMPMYHPHPVPPPEQQVWRSINTRAPTVADVAFPIGHLWRWGKNEWELEAIVSGAAQWRQTSGQMLIYNNTTPEDVNFLSVEIEILGSNDIADYSLLFFYGAPFGIATNPVSDHLVSYLDFSSPISTPSAAFINGKDVYMYRRAAGGSPETIALRYVSARRILVQTEDTGKFYLSQIYGVL